MPTASFPLRLLHVEVHNDLARDVPCTRRESRPLRQRLTIVFRCSSNVFRIHPVVHKCEKGRLVGTGRVRAVVPNPFVREVIAIRDLFGHRHGLGYRLADPGCHGTTTQLE